MTQRRQARAAVFLALAVLAAAACAILAADAWAPPQDLPWKPLALDQPVGLATGWKVWWTGGDASRCRRILSGGGVDFRPDAARGRPPYAVSAGGRMAMDDVALAPTRPLMGCREALAFAVWERQVVQPEARAVLGAPVTAIEHLGTYNCRPVRGAGELSQHAFANAIDVSGFRLADGREITVAHDFRSADAAGEFLRRVRDQSCRVFRVTLSPDFNADHRDHFHLDMGPWGQCR